MSSPGSHSRPLTPIPSPPPPHCGRSRPAPSSSTGGTSAEPRRAALLSRIFAGPPPPHTPAIKPITGGAISRQAFESAALLAMGAGLLAFDPPEPTRATGAGCTEPPPAGRVLAESGLSEYLACRLSGDRPGGCAPRTPAPPRSEGAGFGEWRPRPRRSRTCPPFKLLTREGIPGYTRCGPFGNIAATGTAAAAAARLRQRLQLLVRYDRGQRGAAGGSGVQPHAGEGPGLIRLVHRREPPSRPASGWPRQHMPFRV